MKRRNFVVALIGVIPLIGFFKSLFGTPRRKSKPRNKRLFIAQPKTVRYKIGQSVKTNVALQMHERTSNGLEPILHVFEKGSTGVIKRIFGKNIIGRLVYRVDIDGGAGSIKAFIVGDNLEAV